MDLFDLFVREDLRSYRLIGGAVVGVLIAVFVIALAGVGAAVVLIYVSVAVLLVALAARAGALLYLRTERGRAARDAYLAKRQRAAREREVDQG